jgi:AcrR family transcriptional regulator
MSDGVKSGKRRGGARNAQARATRRRIIDAAAQLFIADGYAATTLEQIAERAGVAVQTVYFHFGNKRTVLKEAVDVAAVGDDEPVALLERPFYQQLDAEPDPRRLIARWVQNGRDILGRIAPIMRVVRDAAGIDPDMAAQWTTNEQQRATAFRVLAQQLADRRALKPGTSVDDATDIVIALLSIEVYLLLAARGWDPQRWEKWITTMLTTALLQSPPTVTE